MEGGSVNCLPEYDSSSGYVLYGPFPDWSPPADYQVGEMLAAWGDLPYSNLIDPGQGAYPVWRAISGGELSDIQQNGFRPNPNGGDYQFCKLFFLCEEDATSFARDYGQPYVIQAGVPASIPVENLNISGEGAAIAVPVENLPSVTPGEVTPVEPIVEPIFFP